MKDKTELVLLLMVIVAAGLLFTGCDKDTDEIQQPVPNSPSEVHVNYCLNYYTGMILTRRIKGEISHCLLGL